MQGVKKNLKIKQKVVSALRIHPIKIPYIGDHSTSQSAQIMHSTNAL